MRSWRGPAATLMALALAACGVSAASVPPPDGAPRGSLLVLETQPCNWLPPPGRCDTVGLARIGLEGQKLEDLTPDQPMPMRPIALSPARDALAWTWNWELWVMPLDGPPRRLNQKLLPESVGEAISGPAWSPDGSELLYRWEGAANEDPVWYRTKVETGETSVVPIPVDCWGMAWSPDGDTVACEVPHRFGERASEVERADIYLIDLATLIATPLTDAEDAIDDRQPDWSPDGRWLTFSRLTSDSADDTTGIWLVEIETGKGRRVAPGRLTAPTWSPDGGHLAAWDEQSGRIVVFGRDGSDLTTLDREARGFGAPRWLSRGG